MTFVDVLVVEASAWVVVYSMAVSARANALGSLPGSKARALADTLTRGHVWLWPLAGPGLILDMVTHPVLPHLLSTLLDLVVLWVWWDARDFPDDDQWKRRKRKVKEMVTQLGRRLVVKVATA